MMTSHFFLYWIHFALKVLLSSVAYAQPPVGDFLMYYDGERERPGIIAYDPSTGDKLELPVTSGVETIMTSGDGRIAYIQDNDIWILDVSNAPNSPINITLTPNEQESLLNWTPDGNLLQYRVDSSPSSYLLYTYNGTEVIAEDYGYNMAWHWNEHGWYAAFYNGNTNGISWYVWNGQERLNLALPTLPAEPAWQTLQWTPDNHLFIIIGYSVQEYMQLVGPTDIFYWNGSVLREVDNPSEDETFMLGDWSTDGRLTLYTSQNYFDRWYIWDGVSFTSNGIPDTSTLTTINGPTEKISDLEWMPDGRLAIVVEGDSEAVSLLGHSFSCQTPCAPQVYLWDRQTLQQLTSNDFGGLLVDVHESGSIAVSNFDGLRIQGVTVFDSRLQPVFQSVSPYSSSRWSADGNLAYCKLNDLLVWNGQDSIHMSSKTFSKWLIAPSPPMLCSTG